VKRSFVTLALAAALIGAPGAARAHDAYDDSQAHPLRLLAYAVYPAGFLLEWAATRPLHFLVSQKSLEPVFGHGPHESPFGQYEPYGPYKPEDQPLR
jgi:hypothetical protein